MKKLLLAPSILSADFSKLAEDVKAAERGGAHLVHVDVMDGHFVPNISFGATVMKSLQGKTSMPFDVHLMIEHPLNNIDLFLDRLRPGDTVYIHPEAEYHPSTTLQKIINAGLIPGIAINPGTSVETIYEMLRIVDRVLVMSVNPGNAGQMFLPYVGKKIDHLLSLREEMNFDVYWDGACSRDKIESFAPKGVKGFVLGSTLLFSKKNRYPFGEIISSIRNMEFKE